MPSLRKFRELNETLLTKIKKKVRKLLLGHCRALGDNKLFFFNARMQQLHCQKHERTCPVM